MTNITLQQHQQLAKLEIFELLVHYFPQNVSNDITDASLRIKCTYVDFINPPGNQMEILKFVSPATINW